MRKLLALNRSEIAIRILRAANELGLRTVAVYSKEDRLALHRFKADEAYLIGKRAMLILIGHWFEFREAAMTGIVSSEIAFAVSSLLEDISPVSAY